MVNAFVVGLLVSVCCALLGVTLVLRRYSMIGDGLSHVGFGALAVATVAGIAPLKLAVPVVVAAAFILLRVSGNGKLKADAAIALISTSSLAIGIMAVSVNGGINTDISNYMFGRYIGAEPLRCCDERRIVGCGYSVFYSVLSQDFCGDFRRDLCEGHRGSGRSLQYDGRSVYGAHYRSGAENDGCSADLCADYLSSADCDANLPDISQRDAVFPDFVCDQFCGGIDFILSVRNTGGRRDRSDRSGVVCMFLRCSLPAAETVKERPRRRDPSGGCTDSRGNPFNGTPLRRFFADYRQRMCEKRQAGRR